MIFRRDTVPNALNALGRFLKHLFFRPESVVVPLEVQQIRLRLCENCEAFVPDSRQCIECTCFVDCKVWLASESCPRKRWSKLS